MVFLFGIMPDEKVIYAFLFTTALFIIFIILLLLRFLKIIKTSYLTILNYSFWTVMTLTVFLIFASFIADFLKKSMCVRKYNLEGNYVIDKEMFNKENALWQYNHYSLNVTEDSLYLIIYNDNKKYKHTQKT